MFIPLNKIITFDQALDTPMGLNIIENIGGKYLMYLSFMSFLITESKDPKSKFAPYLELIPKNSRNFPV